MLKNTNKSFHIIKAICFIITFLNFRYNFKSIIYIFLLNLRYIFKIYIKFL